MAALTNARNTPEMADGGRMRVYPVEANTNVYLGGIVALNAAGNAVPASATTTVANALKVVGRAEYVKNGIPGQNAINKGRLPLRHRRQRRRSAGRNGLLRTRRQQRHRYRSRKRRERPAIRSSRNGRRDRS
jgi:hypothetical protein